MRALCSMLSVALCALASTTQAAGFRLIDVPADSQGPALHGAIWSPCTEPPGRIELGRTVLPGVKDCPLGGEKRALVIISHGRGGSFIGHHDIAEALADAGFVVVALNHPGDTSADLSRSADLSVFVERPADIKRLIDFMLTSSSAASAIDPARIGFFGFSRGGYTGLVVIGANPDWATATEHCRASAAHVCQQILNKEFPAEPLAHDPRIRAAVLADPLAVTFNAASLASVKPPVQLWASEHGGDGVLLHDVAAVDANLAAPHEFHLVRNAGHFAFLPPCPPALTEARPDLCTDQTGFDRVAFHREFNATAVTFFQKHLAVPRD
jgi:predicted dienelactone hydrolase